MWSLYGYRLEIALVPSDYLSIITGLWDSWPGARTSQHQKLLGHRCSTNSGFIEWKANWNPPELHAGSLHTGLALCAAEDIRWSLPHTLRLRPSEPGKGAVELAPAKCGSTTESSWDIKDQSCEFEVMVYSCLLSEDRNIMEHVLFVTIRTCTVLIIRHNKNITGDHDSQFVFVILWHLTLEVEPETIASNYSTARSGRRKAPVSID